MQHQRGHSSTASRAIHTEAAMPYFKGAPPKEIASLYTFMEMGQT